MTITMDIMKGIVLPIYPRANPAEDTLSIRSVEVASTRNES